MGMINQKIGSRRWTEKLATRQFGLNKNGFWNGFICGFNKKTGDKGSLKWIQTIINEHCDLLNVEIKNHIKDDSLEIEWVSPLKNDQYAEYRDGDFLNVLGLQKYGHKLSEFWPERGPQWDALGKTTNNHYFLVEAKANIPEVLSSCSAKSNDSRIKIQNSLGLTKKFLNITSGKNWADGFYQYGNRLAHLYFLREICGVNAFLIFLYFCNDHTHIPTGNKEWIGALTLQKHIMAIKRHKLQKYVLDIFVDVKNIGFKALFRSFYYDHFGIEQWHEFGVKILQIAFIHGLSETMDGLDDDFQKTGFSPLAIGQI